MARKPTVHDVTGGPAGPRSGSVEGLVPPNRHAMSVPTLREVVPHGVVLDAAVVPEGDGALLPAEAALELRRLHVAEEELEHGVALRARELHDAGGEATVHEERLPAGDGMSADEGVLGLGEHLALVLHAVAAAVHVLAFVERGAVFEEALHGLGERLVGRVHAREERVPSDWRQLVHVEDAPHGRLRVAGDVRVPDLARHSLRHLVRVDDEDLRVAFHQSRRGGMDVKLAEASAEGLVLIGREVLIAEEDDPVVDQGVVDLLEGGVVQGRGQIDAVDHGAHVRRELLYADRCWRHGSLLWLDAILWPSPALFNRALPSRTGRPRIALTAAAALPSVERAMRSLAQGAVLSSLMPSGA